MDVTVVFYFWTEQRRIGSSISILGLAKTLEVPNTVLEGNSLKFLMVQQTAPDG
jgi:hypothetical protein